MKAKGALVSLVVLCGAVSGFSQISLLEKPAANLTEKWDASGSGWMANDSSCGWTNGVLEIVCPLQVLGDGFGKTLSLVAKPGASGDVFFGDYSKIQAVSFDMKPTDLTINPTFYFKSAVTGRKWLLPFLKSYVNGQNVTMTLPLDYSTNWIGYRGSDASLRFSADKASITELGFELYRGPNDLNAQQFAIDNLKLVGPWGGPWSNGVPLAWVMENGLTNDFASAGSADNDNDGFTNAGEFLAGTDPVNSNSYFKIEIGRKSTGEIVVKWNGNSNGSYELQEATSLASGSVFSVRTNITPVVAQTAEVVVDQAGIDSRFYKVVIKSKVEGQ